MRWNEKPYHSLDFHLKSTFHEKLYKISLNGGMTCPNRDGMLDFRGCIFCSKGGSGEFAGKPSLSVTEQIEAGKKLLQKKVSNIRYIAYFQAYTNTYAPISYLRSIFTEAIKHPDIAVLSIATRPDCLSTEILELLSELNQIKPVWVELGLQTIHETTAAFIRRGYPLSLFEEIITSLRSRKISVIVHMIIGLPGETNDMMCSSITYLNGLPIQGVKLQLLHILKETDLAHYYEAHPFPVFERDDYVAFIVNSIAGLRPDIVIHRLTGDGPRNLLIAPLWSLNKREILNRIHQEMKLQNLWQGKYYLKEV